MGKKNKKSRRYDDDDLLGPPPDQDNSQDGDDDFATPGAAAAAPADTGTGSENVPPKSTTKKKGGDHPKKDVNIDLILLEETLADIMRTHRDNSDDWLYRTMEKNMHLPKHSLKQTLEPQVFDEMVVRVEQKLDDEYNDEVNRKGRWLSLFRVMCKKSELTEEDEMKLRSEARLVDLDPDSAVALVTKTIRGAVDEDLQQKNTDGKAGEEIEDDKQMNGLNAPLAVSILLALKPYLLQPSSQHSSAGKVLRHWVCLFLYTILSLLLGEQAKNQADSTWDNIHLPSIIAAQLAQELEEDNQMLQRNTHLWSNRQACWIEKDKIFETPPVANPIHPDPPTIRWNDKRKQWERWSKNLTTRTKASKQAAADGQSTSFTKGTFVPVRVGEGWATAPDEPETENKQISSGNIHFFVCLPMEGGELLAVIDVTTWATKTLLTKEAARELGAVDSGKDLFSLDVSTLLADKKKSGKKGKGGKNQKKKVQNDDDEIDEEVNSVARKGVGCTAKFSKRYSDIRQEMS